MKPRPTLVTPAKRRTQAKQAEWNKIAKLARRAGGDGHTGNKTKDALRRLGVTQVQLATCPAITPMLKLANGGLPTIFRAMRFAPDETITAFLRKYDSIAPDDRRRVSVEAVAISAGIRPGDLLGSILIALQAESVSLVKLLCLAAHPAITRARIKYGQQPSGTRDRMALDMALGLLPSPKGTTIIGHAVFGSGRDTMEAQRQLPGRGRPGDGPEDDEDEVPPDFAAEDFNENDPNSTIDNLFPPANQMQERLIAIRNRALPSSTGTPKFPGSGYKN